MKDKFIDLLKSSALVQGSIALVVTSGMIYMYVSGKTVPNELLGIVMIILGYYFGVKTQQIQYQNEEKYATTNRNRVDTGTDNPTRNS